MFTALLAIHSCRPRWLLLATVACSAALSGCIDRADAQGGPPPAAPVSVAPAVQRTVSDSEEFSGRLEASRVRRAAPARGRHDRPACTSSTARWSRRAQLLFSIDPRPFAAEVARAESQLAAARAQRRAGADELARAEKLLDAKAVSRAGIRPAELRRAHRAGRHQAAEAALRAAQLNLELHRSARADRRPHLARQRHRRQPGQRPEPVLTTIAGTRQGLCLLRRQRADLPARSRAGAGRSARRRVRDGPGQRERLPHDGPGRLRRQPPEPADRRDPHARHLRQQRRAASRRACAAQAAHGQQRAYPARAGARARHRHRPDQASSCCRRRRQTAAVPRGQARRAASTACASSPAARQGRRAVVVDGLQRVRARRAGDAAGAEGRRQGHADRAAARAAGARRGGGEKAARAHEHLPLLHRPAESSRPCCRSSSSWSALLAIFAAAGVASTPRSCRRRSWCARVTRAPTRASSPRPWPRRSRSRSTASRTCSTCRRRPPPTAR